MCIQVSALINYPRLWRWPNVSRWIFSRYHNVNRTGISWLQSLIHRWQSRLCCHINLHSCLLSIAEMLHWFLFLTECQIYQEKGCFEVYHIVLVTRKNYLFPAFNFICFLLEKRLFSVCSLNCSSLFSIHNDIALTKMFVRLLCRKLTEKKGMVHCLSKVIT